MSVASIICSLGETGALRAQSVAITTTGSSGEALRGGPQFKVAAIPLF
jgi:hypothetical protein